MVILSMNRDSHEVHVGVEDCLRNFSKTVYQYSLIIILSFVTIYALLDVSLGTVPNSVKVLFKTFLKSFKRVVWKSLFMFINRENLIPKTRPAAAVYICFSFFAFCLVNSFFGLMSADLVKQIDPPIINTVKDLLYHEDFKNLDIITPKGAWQEQGFLASVNGSDGRKLWDRKGPKFRLSLTNFEYFSKVIQTILKSIRLRKAVFIFDTLPMNLFISIGCQASLTEYGPYLHLSDEKFIPGNLMLAYNPNIRLQLKNYFDDSYRKIQESGWIGYFFSQLGYKINFGSIGEFQIYKCVQFIRGKEKDVPPPFDIHYMSKPFIAAICMMIIALITLLLEYSIFKFIQLLRLGMKKGKKKNVRKKQGSIN